MEFLILFLIGISGIILHIAFKFQDAVSKEAKGGRKFKERFLAVWAKFDILGNLAYSAVAIIVVIVLVAIRNDLETILPITKVSILFIGYTADSAFKNLKPEALK